jgi:hypothetical protein
MHIHSILFTVRSESCRREAGPVVGAWRHFRTPSAESGVAELPGTLVTTVSAFNYLKFGAKVLHSYCHEEVVG